MKKIYTLIFTILLVLVYITTRSIFTPKTDSYSTNHSYQQFEKNKRYLASVESVVDGDTLWVSVDDFSFKARLLSINAPEATEKVEPFGYKATDYVKEVIKNAKKIEIEFDSGEYADKYNRALIYIFLDGELLNESILKEGLAEVKYVKKGGDKYIKKMRKAEKYAKDKQLNIWSQ